jgi:hypothetical protein
LLRSAQANRLPVPAVSDPRAMAADRDAQRS